MEQRFAGNIIHYSLKLLILYLDAIWIIKEENIYVKLLIADFADNSFSDEVGANVHCFGLVCAKEDTCKSTI
jgi:hypothetical protein